MKKSSYQINSSVKHSGAPLSDDQSKKTDVKQHLKNRPIPSQHAPIDGVQHNSCLSKPHDLTGELRQPACKARENHTSVEDNKKPEGVGAQVKVSVVWIQGGLIFGNLAVLVTALVTIVAWYQLRQEHIMAMTEKIEDQDVIVRAVEGGWRLEVGLVITGLGLLLNWLLGGVIMPLRIGDCKGFALGTYLVFNVAAVLWQVCAALAIFHILPTPSSFSHVPPGTERFLIRWGAWLSASYISCLPVQLISAAVHISFDSSQEEDEEGVQLRRHMDREGQGVAKVKPEAAVGSERASQDLAFYVTEMPAEQLKRKSQEPLSPFSRIRSESNNSTLPPSFRSVYLNSTKRFDDYSFYYDEYLDMEECWEESDQEEGESIFCSGATPPPPYTLAINV